MRSEKKDQAKRLYKELRSLPWERLWGVEVARFNAASPQEREQTVAVIRAVGVFVAESGLAEEKENVRVWLVGLLLDPSEKVRRYAMSALPKIGAGSNEEAKLLSGFQSATEEREKKYLARTLARIGGAAALEVGLPTEAKQKIQAALARQESPSALRAQAVLSDITGLRIQLRGRHGLERIVRDEVEQTLGKQGGFRVEGTGPGRVTLVPLAPFSLANLYTMRCFGAVGLVLGQAQGGSETQSIEGLADLITSPLSQRLFHAFTEGALRYRLNFVAKGHQRAAVSRLAELVYARCPDLLNDGRSVTWTMDIYPGDQGQLVELRPNMTPDPRFAYRQMDVPAASHPPLAACLARLAGCGESEVAWDPFCGSGLELIERALLGSVRQAFGSDLSEDALRVAQTNLAASDARAVPAKFLRGDFRDIAASKELGAGKVTLVITNPPMGMRVPVADLTQLMQDLFHTAAKVLKRGGRLVLVNPISKSSPPPSLRLEYQQKVDMGGFECSMEKYLRL